MKKNSAIAIENNNKSTFLTMLKGAFFALFASLILVLIFAIILRFSNLSNNVIKPINQVIKILSILFGTVFALKKLSGHGYLKGIFIGLIYYVLSFVVFSLLDGSFAFQITMLNDLLFAIVVGAVSGVISSLAKK